MTTPTRVALVTGSGKRRIGWYVADALAGRGYALAVHYRTSVAEGEETVAALRARGVEAMGIRADVTDEAAVRSMVDQVRQRFGRLDVLVTCAAIWQNRRLEEVTAADMRRNFEVNTLGTFLCAKYAGLLMAGQPEGGCLITMGDWAEVRPYLNYAAYFASKGAVTALTRSLAVELGSRNPRVRVNCVLPGPVLFAPDLPAEERAQAIRATLVKHEGNPQNVAQAVLALVDNDFITGAFLPVDGGRTVYAPEG